MALTVATNTGALMAQAAASSVNKEMETSMERLSTGKRINGASDDAAGVAIASRLTAEIKGTNQAIRNALDGQAMLDTAEGSHIEVESILQRMRELAVQASNGSNDANDRAMLQLEVDALLTEVDRISQASTWAGQALLNGTAGSALATSHADTASFTFQVGSRTHSADQIVASVGAITSAALGLSTVSDSGSASTVSTAGPARMTVTGGNVQVEGDLKHGDKLDFDVNNVQVSITFSTTDEYTNDLDGVSAQLKDKIDSLVTAGTIKSPVEAVDNGNGSVTLSQLSTPTITTVGKTSTNGTFTVSGSTFTAAGTWAQGDKATATINGTVITYTSAANDGFDSDALVGVAAGFVDQVRSSKALENIVATDNGDGTVTISQLEIPEIQSAEVTLKSAAEASITYDDTNKLTIGGSFVDGMNYSFDLFGKNISVTASTTDGFADTKAGVASQIAAAINDAGIHGITAAKTANENAVTITGKVTAANGVTNSGTEFLVTTVGAQASAEIHVNDDATQTDKAATYTAGDSYSFDVAGQTFTLVVGSDGFENDKDGVTQQMIELIENAHIPGLKVTADKGTTAGVKVEYDLTTKSGGGGSEVITNVKVMDQATASGTTAAASADTISIATVENAASAITKIDTAMDTINAQRASLGATLNRLDSTVSNLTNITNNLAAGKGRIEDADFAAETTSLAKSQILQQASTAMLAQANASKQNVLSLLQG